MTALTINCKNRKKCLFECCFHSCFVNNFMKKFISQCTILPKFFCLLQISLGHFRLYRTLCGSFQVVSCSLQVISGHFLLTAGRLKLHHVNCSSFQVVPCPLQVISGCFLLVSGLFLLVVGRFRLFQVIPRFSKYWEDLPLKENLPEQENKRSRLLSKSNKK